MLCVASMLCGQDALTELKKQAFANPLSEVNQGLISMLNNMSVQEVDLLLFSDWQPLHVVGRGDELLKVDSANYHIELNTILFVRHGQMHVLYPSKVRQAMLGEHKFVSMPFVVKQRMARAFFEVLTEGEFTLLRKYALVEKVTNTHPMGTAATRDITLEPGSDLFYHQARARHVYPLPGRKRDVIMLFRRSQADMVAFARDRKLSVRQDEDMQELFRFYNELVMEE